MEKNQTVRTAHRYLGFFLAGIMMMYASSGILLIFRKTDTLKFDVEYHYALASAMRPLEVLDALKLKGLSVTGETEAQVLLNMGYYEKASGLAHLTVKEYPAVVEKIVGIHKATTKSPLYFFNIFFGSALLFFAISAFFVFPSSAPAWRAGIKVASAGFLMALLVITFG